MMQVCPKSDGEHEGREQMQKGRDGVDDTFEGIASLHGTPRSVMNEGGSCGAHM